MAFVHVPLVKLSLEKHYSGIDKIKKGSMDQDVTATQSMQISFNHQQIQHQTLLNEINEQKQYV